LCTHSEHKSGQRPVADEFAENTYKLNFHSSEPSLWASAEKQVKVRLKKR